MYLDTEKWESVLRTDPALDERLRRLNTEGYPATKKGDLLSIKVENDTPVVVSWDGHEIHVSKRNPKNPFCTWTMDEKTFQRLFHSNSPPLLVAMNHHQDKIKMGVDHHNGSLVLSFMVLLQECREGGANQ